MTPDVTPPEMALVGDYLNNIYVSHETEMDLWTFNQKLRDWDPGVVVSDEVDSELEIVNSYTDPHFLGVRTKNFPITQIRRLKFFIMM